MLLITSAVSTDPGHGPNPNGAFCLTSVQVCMHPADDQRERRHGFAGCGDARDILISISHSWATVARVWLKSPAPSIARSGQESSTHTFSQTKHHEITPTVDHPLPSGQTVHLVQIYRRRSATMPLATALGVDGDRRYAQEELGTCQVLSLDSLARGLG